MDLLYKTLLSQINTEYVDEFNKRFEILKPNLLVVFEKINLIAKKKDIIWAGSSFLYLCGIVDEFNDINIFILLNSRISRLTCERIFYNENIKFEQFFGYNIKFDNNVRIIFILDNINKKLWFDIDLCKTSISLINYKFYISHCICGNNLVQNHIIKSNIFSTNDNLIFGNKGVKLNKCERSIFNFPINITPHSIYHYSKIYRKYFFLLLSSIIRKKSDFITKNLSEEDFEILNNYIEEQKKYYLLKVTSKRTMGIELEKTIMTHNKILSRFLLDKLKFMFDEKMIYETIFCFLKQDYCKINCINERIIRYSFNNWYYKTFCYIRSKYLKKKLSIQSDICTYCSDEEQCITCYMEFINQIMTNLYFKCISSLKCKYKKEIDENNLKKIDYIF